MSAGVQDEDRVFRSFLRRANQTRGRTSGSLRVKAEQIFPSYDAVTEGNEARPGQWSHLQVVQQAAEVQPPFSRIPVVVRTDVLEAGVGKDGIVVL